MTSYTIQDVTKTFNAVLADLLLGDQQTQLDPNRFLSVLQPGLPFSPQDFDFAAYGIGSTMSSAPAPTPDPAQTARKNWTDAATFAMAVDFIPDIAGVYSSGQQSNVFTPDFSLRLSRIYKVILDSARVVDDQLTAQEQARLDHLRSLLTTTKTVTDIVTGEAKQVTAPSDLVTQYLAYQQAFRSALLQYNAKKIAAATSADPAVIEDFAYNGALYREQVDSAMGQWEAEGYKGDYEEVVAAIDALTRQSMAGWRMQLREDYDSAVLTTPDGTPFLSTLLIPGGFALAPSWTKYGFDQHEIAARTATAATTWQAAGGASIGLVTVAAAADGSTATSTHDCSVDDFSMSFELTQVEIARPWLSTEFLKNRGWDLVAGEGWTYDQMPSDGLRPPQGPTGNFIGFAEQAAFVRNVTIRSSSFVAALKQASSTFEGHGAISIGPVVLEGGGTHTTSSIKYDLDEQSATVTVNGMQMIATSSYLFPKVPNLLESLSDSDLVGL